MTIASAETAGHVSHPGDKAQLAMVVDGGVVYSEPGAQPRAAAGSGPALAAANPVARLFARVINGVLLFLLSGVFWLAVFVTVAVIVVGDEVRYIWPMLSEVPVSDTPGADKVVGDALAEYWETYSVGAVTLDAAALVLIPLGAALLAFIMRLMYLTLMVRFAGGDFGHLVLGLRVVNYNDGRRPSFGRALGRALLKQLDGLIILWLINGVMVLVAPERRHLYDLAVNTMVVRAGETALLASENHTATLSMDAPQLTERRQGIPLPPSRS